MLLWNNHGDLVCTSFPHELSCALRVTTAYCSQGLIMPPASPISFVLTSSYFSCSHSIHISPSSPQSISLPSESESLGGQLVTTPLLTLLSQHREYHALRTKHSLSPQPSFLLPGYPLRALLLFPAKSSGCSLLTSPLQFSLCATHLGSATWSSPRVCIPDVTSHRSRQRHSTKVSMS